MCRPRRYLLALKLKAIRVNDPSAAIRSDLDDVRNLMRVRLDQHRRRSSGHRDLARTLLPEQRGGCREAAIRAKDTSDPRELPAMRPDTLAEAIRAIVDGEPQEKALPEFVDTFLSRADGRKSIGQHRGEPVQTDDRATGCARRRRWPNTWPSSIGSTRVPKWVSDPCRRLDRALVHDLVRRSRR